MHRDTAALPDLSLVSKKGRVSGWWLVAFTMKWYWGRVYWLVMVSPLSVTKSSKACLVVRPLNLVTPFLTSSWLLSLVLGTRCDRLELFASCVSDSTWTLLPSPISSVDYFVPISLLIGYPPTCVSRGNIGGSHVPFSYVKSRQRLKSHLDRLVNGMSVGGEYE